MKEFRTKVKALLLALTGVIVALIIIRLLLLATGADQTQPIVNLLLSLTNPIVSPFIDFNQFLGNSTIEAAGITALMVVIVGGLLITDIVTAFMYEDPADIVLNLVDALFKVLEATLIIRLVFKLFGIPATAGWFVANVYSATSWASGVVPDVKVFNGALEVSTLIILIIVAIIDFATEGVVSSFRRRAKANAVAKAAAPAPVVVTPSAPAAQPVEQHITINVPAPTMAPGESATVTVPAQNA